MEKTPDRAAPLASRDIDFLYEVGAFRFVERTWKHFFRGARVANDAEHTFRVMWIALTLARMEGHGHHEKILKMAMMHDLAESRTGDTNYVSRLYTTQDDHRAMADVLADTAHREEMLLLYEEYEKRESIEARIVKDADHLDVDFEIVEQSSSGKQLAAQWKESRRLSVRSRLFTESAKRLFDEIYSADPHHWHLSARNRFTEGDLQPKHSNKK